MPPSQVAKPAAQLPEQWPVPSHVWPPWHGLPQAPQLAMSVSVSVQKVAGAVPQSFGTLAGQAQPPSLQLSPAGHAVPQAPQFWSSAFTSTQRPVLAQKVPVGGRQVEAQIPPVQTRPAPHASPPSPAQPPQLAGSFWRFAQ